MDLETREQRAGVLEKVLAELVKSMRSCFMYPPGHPSLKKSYENSYHYFRDFLDAVGEFSFTSDKEGIDYEEAPLTQRKRSRQTAFPGTHSEEHLQAYL